ncbi:hypothetical protein R3P38DRAFT_1962243 [Favolaschia claudopus]|uniref:Uncharacterized protein n=1 Tax=Favolaschia claudopus TaxID=2862362 RepID=A0AAV9ZZI7_9AGAR
MHILSNALYSNHMTPISSLLFFSSDEYMDSGDGSQKTQSSDAWPTGHNTIITGGIGGSGGSGGIHGGAGGHGQGPQFNVAGVEKWNIQVHCGNFSSHVVGADSVVDPELREFRLCDINLQHEIYMDDSQSDPFYSTRKRRGVRVVRRFHQAEVERRRGTTVVTYEGRNAEEEWRRDMAQYMEFRHSSFVQLYGTVHSRSIYAIIFYDDLIPFKEFLNLYRDHPMLPCYIHAYVSHEFEAAQDYLNLTFNTRLSKAGYTLLISRPSGRLCIDLVGRDYYRAAKIPYLAGRRSPIEILSSAVYRNLIINSLTLEQYHQIWDAKLFILRFIVVSSSTTVCWGSVCSATVSEGPSELVAVASLPDVDVQPDDHWHSTIDFQPEEHITASGWTRFSSFESLRSEDLRVLFWFHVRGSGVSNKWLCQTWISQANHVFNRLGVKTNLNNYVVVDKVDFTVGLKPGTHAPKHQAFKGYLFLCPTQDFQIGPGSFKWPDCPAYWSLDPLGGQRLSAEEAGKLGFPTIEISTDVWGISGDDAAYAGLAEFHQIKGFDPETQDVARHLGLALYQFEHSPNSQPCFIEDPPVESNEARHDAVGKWRNVSYREAVTTQEECKQSLELAERTPSSRSAKIMTNIQLLLLVLASLLALYDIHMLPF